MAVLINALKSSTSTTVSLTLMSLLIEEEAIELITMGLVDGIKE